MLSGKRAFEGDDVSDTLAVVLRGEPDWNALPVKISPAVIALIRGCLEKDRRRRIGDLSTARFIFDHREQIAAGAPAPSVSRIRRATLPLVVAAAAAVIAGYAAWTLKPASLPSLPLARFTLMLPSGEQFSSAGRHLVALSPDDTHLVYVANQRLYVRALDQLEAQPIRGTEGTGPGGGTKPIFLS
jgi:hypothetical protein